MVSQRTRKAGKSETPMFSGLSQRREAQTRATLGLLVGFALGRWERDGLRPAAYLSERVVPVRGAARGRPVALPWLLAPGTWSGT